MDHPHKTLARVVCLLITLVFSTLSANATVLWPQGEGEIASAYVGTRVYVLVDVDALLSAHVAPSVSGKMIGDSGRVIEGLRTHDFFLRLLAWTPDPNRGKLLETGDAVVTCGVTNDADPVVALFEVRTPVTMANSYNLTSGSYPIWNRPMELHPASWSFTNLGNVFGIAVDRERNILTTASSSYSPQLNLLSQPNGTSANVNFSSGTGAIGRAAAGPNATAELNAAGTVYKLDAVTGTPTVFAVLPQQATTAAYTAFIRAGTTNFNLSTGNRFNTGPGLGNIVYDKDNDQFFVTNFEDGKIYRISADGTVQPMAYDFGAPDNGAAGMPPLQDRVWGVGIYDGRLYYSVWTDKACQDNGNCGVTLAQYYDNGPNPTVKPFIRSLVIDPVTGDFQTATDRLEYDGSDLEHTAPISDIAFDAEGNMLIAQKTMLTDYAGYNHRSQVAYLTGGNGTWTADPFFTGPRENPTNANRYGTEAYGGVDFGYNGTDVDATIWYSSADMVRDGNIGNGSQGPHGIAGFLLSDLTSDFPDPRAIVPYDGAVTSPSSIDLKGSGGDIEIVGDYVSLGNLVWEDTNDNGVLDGAEAGIPGVTVNLLNAGGTVLLLTTTTNAAGQYLFTDLLPGDYVVEVIPPAGYSSSTGSMFLLETGASEPAPDPDMLVAVDSDDNGTTTGTAIRSAPVTLEEMQEPEGETGLTGLTDFVADNSANYTVDFGLIPPCDLSITSLDVQCSAGTTFTVLFNVEWTGINAAAGSISVSVDGMAQTPIVVTNSSGSMSFGPVAVDGPADCVLIEADFSGAQICSATTSVDLVACTPECTNTLGGNVFNDTNNDGADAGAVEVGQANVLVEIYECDSDVPVATAYTNENGDWSVDDAGITYPVRVEFSTPLQDYLDPSVEGTNNGTNVQIVDEPSCFVDYAVVDPSDACLGMPRIVAPCYIGGTAASQGAGDVLVDFNYDGSGAIRTVATGSQIGATWGVAYAVSSQTLYVSEVVRRHSGTASTNQNVIYAIDYSGATPSAPVPFITLAGVGGVTRDLAAVQNTDAATFTAAATSGIGDIDLSADGQTLYVTNLDESRVDVIDVATATVTGSITFPTLDGCTLRPWALNVTDGQVYAGAVCEDALRAYVFRAKDGEFSVLDLNTADATEDFFDLSYLRESVWALNPTFSGAGDCNADELIPIATQWNTWINTFPAPICVSPFGDADDYVIYPQAILSDIEFDTDGSIILGFLDRMGLQGGFQQPDTDGNGQFVTIAGGDIIRICATADGFAPEGTTGCAQNDTGDDAGYQPAGTSTNAPNAALDDGAEFYNGDDWLNGSGDGEHYENALGGLVLLPGSGEVTTSVYDPINGTFNAGGVRWLSNTTGESVRALQLYQNTTTPAAFAKAAGIGDLELVCAPLPIQIGNYVWEEGDIPDGVQQACEDPIVSLPVSLYTKDDDGTLTLVATTMTDGDGEYYFTGDGTTGETWVNSGDAVLSDTTYLIVFGDTPATDTTFTYNGTEYRVTQDSTGEGNNPGLNDSDAVFTDVNGNNLPAVCYSTADTADHTLDVGLIPVVPCEISIANVTVNCTNGTDFTISFDVTWDFEDAQTDMIEVSVDGDAQTPFTPLATDGTTSFGPIAVSGPAYDVIIDAIFLGNTACVDRATADLIACTDPCATGDLGGNVFNDLDNNGADAGAMDVGQANVLVEIYECDSDVPVATTYTNENGDWSVDDEAITYPVRVEFSTPLQDYLKPNLVGTDNGTNTQFVTTPSCEVNYGVIDEALACGPAIIENHALGELSSQGILLSSGIAVVTCGIIDDPSIPMAGQYTFGLIDIRGVTVADGRPQATLVDYHHPDWTVTQIGNVFGTTTDDGGNFYATASSHYGAAFGYVLGGDQSNFRPSIIRYGEIGGGEDDVQAAGTVYMMDAVTGQPTVFAQLPQQSFAFTHVACESGETFNRTSGPGLGNIEYDDFHEQFFVSNFEDGAIYRLAPDGTVLDSFDPQTLIGFTVDDGTAGFANDYKPYGLAVSPDGTRLYFGIHPVDDDPITSLIEANVYYVDLADDGSFFGTEQFVVTTLPDPPGPAFSGDFNAFGVAPAWYSVSDLNFNPDGELVIGHRSGCGDGTNPVYASSHNHGASYFIYDVNTGVLTNVETRYAGDLGTDGVNFSDGTGNDDVYGGIGIWDTYDGEYVYVVSSSDIQNEVGPHGLMVFPDDFTQTGNGTTEYILRPAAAIAYFESFDNNDFKGVGGDIDVYSPCGPIPIQLGNYVWIDADEDGVQDPCEEPVDALPVSLYTKGDDGNLTLVATTTTSLTGEYYFTGDGTAGEVWTNTGDMVLADTTYLIVFGDTPESDTSFLFNGQEFAVTIDSSGTGNNPNLNDSDGVFTDVNGVSLPAICYSTADTTDHTLDLGIKTVALLSLGSTVFEDLDNNGTQDGDDDGIAGVTLELYRVVGDKDDDTNAETDDVLVTVGSDGDLLTADDGQPYVTDMNGDYLFTNLEAGDYYVVVPVSNFADGSVLDSIPFSSTDIGTSAADNQTDGDDNGLQPDGVATRVCSPVINLAPGDEPVDGTGINDEFAQGAGQDNVGDLLDENGDMTVDFGFFRPVSLGSTVFEDENNNGLLEATEPGIEDVTLELYRVVGEKDDDVNQETDDVLVDVGSDGDALTPTDNAAYQTDADGNYLFTGLEPGDYYVVVPSGNFDDASALENIPFSSTDIATTDADNQVDGDDNGLQPDGVATEVCSPVITLAAGDEPTDGTGANDEAGPGADQDNDAPSLDANGDMTVDFGFYRPVSIGSTVFEDLNNDGDQDSGEPGIAEVTLELYEVVNEKDDATNGETDDVLIDVGSDGDALTPTDNAVYETDMNGDYIFRGIAPGDYYVVIPESEFAPGETLEETPYSSMNLATSDGDNQTDGDDNGLQPDGVATRVCSPVISLRPGEEPTNDGAFPEDEQGAEQDDIVALKDINGDMTVDFSFFAPVSLGDTAFVDLNGNGLQDADDPGIGGVTVMLLDENGNMVTEDAEGNPITGTTVTAADGSYSFDNLPPGVYSVKFDYSTADNAEFYVFTTAGAGDDTIDSDNDIVVSDSVAQSNPTDFLLSGERDSTLDVGLVCNVSVTLADPFTICATATIDLTQEVTITPDTSATFGATWTTPDGTGDFLDEAGNVLTEPFRFGEAVQYDPSPADAQRGSVTLILTTDDPEGPCEPVSAQVTIQILKVDCGEFFWDGND